MRTCVLSNVTNHEERIDMDRHGHRLVLYEVSPIVHIYATMF
jgi:hypothetical protein